MSGPKICKGVLELLLQVKIDHIEYPELSCFSFRNERNTCRMISIE